MNDTLRGSSLHSSCLSVLSVTDSGSECAVDRVLHVICVVLCMRIAEVVSHDDHKHIGANQLGGGPLARSDDVLGLSLPLHSVIPLHSLSSSSYVILVLPLC